MERGFRQPRDVKTAWDITPARSGLEHLEMPTESIGDWPYRVAQRYCFSAGVRPRSGNEFFSRRHTSAFS